MKKTVTRLVLALTLVSSSAFAWGPHEQGILTGVAGFWAYQQLTRPQQQVIVQQPPVYIQSNPAPVYYPQQPQVVYSRGYHYEQILDANCNCFRVVLVPN